jgi:hypothetical protein
MTLDPKGFPKPLGSGVGLAESLEEMNGALVAQTLRVRTCGSLANP